MKNVLIHKKHQKLQFLKRPLEWVHVRFGKINMFTSCFGVLSRYSHNPVDIISRPKMAALSRQALPRPFLGLARMWAEPGAAKTPITAISIFI